MARSLVFGNGRLHVGLDEHGFVHDLYYPYIGLENHMPSKGLAHKVGVFVESTMSWLDEPNWKIESSYHYQAMIGKTVVTNDKLGLRLEYTDAVDTDADTFLRAIHIINLRDNAREIKLFYHQAFMIGNSSSSDSAQYRPDLPAVMHYKGNRMFFASLLHGTEHFDDYSVGRFDAYSGESTFHDAEDGILSKNMVENGHVDSVLGVSCHLEAFGSTHVQYILVAAEDIAAGEALLQEVIAIGVLHYITRTAAYWREWVLKAALPRQLLSEEYAGAVEQSLWVIKSHMDERGAVMASLDSSLRDHPQDDTYNFCWPRDAAYALWPLLRLGYTDELKQFFDFARQTLHEDGYMYHKYRADGSLGSTWLPYEHPDGTVHPPIQADETASVLFLVGQYYRQTNDQSFVVDYYLSLIEPMGNFLAGYVSEDGLPLPSYDLWEHVYGVHTYTTALTYAALVEAAELAQAYGRLEDAERWGSAAMQMKRSAGRLWNSAKSFFYRGFVTTKEGALAPDETLDASSLYGAFMYGLFDVDDERFAVALETARAALSEGPLFSRFEGDDYYDGGSGANLWPVVSLWMAEIALERDESDKAREAIDAVLELRSFGGMIPEQVSRGSHQVSSLSPLAWSHAELVGAILDFAQAERKA